MTVLEKDTDFQIQDTDSMTITDAKNLCQSTFTMLRTVCLAVSCNECCEFIIHDVNNERTVMEAKIYDSGVTFFEASVGISNTDVKVEDVDVKIHDTNL